MMLTGILILAGVLGAVPFQVTPARLSITACRGEYEPVVLHIKARNALSSLMAEVTDLRGLNGAVLQSSQVDTRWLIPWYQAGDMSSHPSEPILVKELLLHAPALIRVDHSQRTNWIRNGPPGSTDYRIPTEGQELWPYDTGELQPISVAAGEDATLWLTVHIPPDARPGKYIGNLLVSGNGRTKRVPLQIVVNDLVLPGPRLTYAVYYRAMIHGRARFGVSSEYKTPEQYRAELEDMMAHGVQYPTMYQQPDPMEVPQALAVRNQVGLPQDRLFYLGFSTGTSTSQERMELVADLTELTMEWAAQAGYGDVYFYGSDEASGNQLIVQRLIWEMVRTLGGKMCVACYADAFGLVGDLLDVAILHGKPDSAQARAYHSFGHEIFVYGYPQTAPASFEMFRRNYGIVPWLAGYDGVMPYAYQHGFGHIWNDFDHAQYRDHAFAYPVADGVVPTVQWEGFREAVDDVRYLTALEQAIATTKNRKARKEAQKWMAQLKPSVNLDEMRRRVLVFVSELEAPVR